MSNKHPKAVVTDGDGAMREAIRHVFPEASHRLCAWHLHNNACENVKHPAFLEDFKTAMYTNFSPEQFEEYWENMVEKHGVVGNRWVSKTYENKSLWATAYLRDKFFGRIRTTSQCEAINSVIKVYVKKKSSMVEFMHNFHRALREYRNNEFVADFKGLYSEPVMTTPLVKIEKEASKVYTVEIFREVKQQIEKACVLNVIGREEAGEKLNFKLSKYCNPGSEKMVVYDTANSTFNCQCRLFESRDIPCAHIIFVMKNEHMEHIPSNLILARWKKNAKRDFLYSSQADEVEDELTNTVRYSAFIAACNALFEAGRNKSGCFTEMVDDIYNLTLKYKNKGDQRSSQSGADNNIGEPTKVKTKGATKKKKFTKKRHCSNCTSTGHTIRRCPVRSGTADASTFDDQRSPSEDIEMSIPVDHEREVMDHDDSKEQVNICNDRGSQSLKKGKGKGMQKISVGTKRKENNRKDKTLVLDKDHVAEHDMHTSGSEPVNVLLQNVNPGVQAVNPGVQAVNQGMQTVNPGVQAVNPVLQFNAQCVILEWFAATSYEKRKSKQQ